MIKTFIVIKDNIKHVFDDVDIFKVKIKTLKEVNNKIEHELSVIKNDEGMWGIIATICNNGEDKTKIHEANVALFKTSEL